MEKGGILHCDLAGNVFPKGHSHWLLGGHMTPNNETVSCQNL